MRRQSAMAVIDEGAEKVGRILARRASSLTLARQANTAAMIDAIWQELDGVPQGTGGGAGAEVGAIMMPFGLITCGILLFVGLGFLSPA